MENEGLELTESQEAIVSGDDTPSLPSETQEPEAVDYWAKLQEANPDDGFINKYNSVEDFSSAYKNMQSMASKNETTNKEVSEEAATKQTQNDVIRELAPEFVNNNMQVSDEMLTKLTDAGLDAKEVKIAAYELRDQITQAHEVVGGREQYDAMLAWAGETLTDSQKSAFDGDVQSSNSEFAIRGLYGMYKEANSGPQQPQRRIDGDAPARQAVKGYQSQAEINADINFMRMNPMDAGAKARYEHKMSMTDATVVMGR